MLFCGLNNLDPTRYNVYCGQLELASKSGLLDMVTTDIDQVSCSLYLYAFSVEIYHLTEISFSGQAVVKSVG